MAIEDPDDEIGSSDDLCRAIAFFRSNRSRPATPFAFTASELPDEDDEDEATTTRPIGIPRDDVPPLIADTESSEGSVISTSPTESLYSPGA